jgi:FAD synthase
VRLSFFARVRDERTFPSLQDLTAQIRLDVEATRAYFAKHPIA